MGDSGSASGRDREAEVDAALADLDEIAAAPLEEHHQRLAHSHEVLHRALTEDPEPENGQTRH